MWFRCARRGEYLWARWGNGGGRIHELSVPRALLAGFWIEPAMQPVGFLSFKTHLGILPAHSLPFPTPSHAAQEPGLRQGEREMGLFGGSCTAGEARCPLIGSHFFPLKKPCARRSLLALSQATLKKVGHESSQTVLSRSKASELVSV